MGNLNLGLGTVFLPSAIPVVSKPTMSAAPTVTDSPVEATALTSDENDAWLFDGTPATVVSREYRLLINNVLAVGPLSSATVVLPDGSAGDAFSFQLRVIVEEGSGAQSAWTPIASGSVLTGFGLSETIDAELELLDADGTLHITVLSPAAYADHDAGNGAGIFTFNTADLDAGPVNLVPPQIADDGTPEPEETLNMVPGLWIYDGANSAPAVTSQWQRDGADIAGAIATAHTLDSADAGASINVVETATERNGTRSASSLPIAIPAPLATAPIYSTSVNQSATLGNGQTDSLSIAAAGDYIVAIACIGGAAFSAAMSNGDTVTPLTAHRRAGNVGVTWFHIAATAAADFVYENISSDDSFTRQLVIYDAGAASAVMRNDSFDDTVNSSAVSTVLTGLNVGDHVLACVVDRKNQSDVFAPVWGDDLQG
ncbi:MAG: hypothetical protein AAGE38_12820, partial [Pseudomonadota bacterium]